MPFQKGRKKTGGRQKQYSTKLEAKQILDKVGLNPIQALALMALDENNTPAIRRLCLADLAPYVYSRLRTIDVTGSVQHDHQHSVQLSAQSVLARLDLAVAAIEAPAGDGSVPN